MGAREQATIEARDARIADLEAQIDQYRYQVAAPIVAGIAKKHPRPVRPKANAKPVPLVHRPSPAFRKKLLPNPPTGKIKDR
jgi:hypothetical protein